MDKLKPRGTPQNSGGAVKGNWEEICRLIGHTGLTVGLLGGDHLGSEQNSNTDFWSSPFKVTSIWYILWSNLYLLKTIQQSATIPGVVREGDRAYC